MTTGEKLVKNYLDSRHFQELDLNDKEQLNSNRNNRLYIYGYEDNWLGKLHLDFYVQYFGMYIGIEYDGRQHFGIVNWENDQNSSSIASNSTNAVREYEKYHIHDIRKDMLCSIHDVALIRLEDVGDLSSTNPIKAQRLVNKILDKELSKNLLLNLHSYIRGPIKDYVSWNNPYYNYIYAGTVIKECKENSKKLSTISTDLLADVKLLYDNSYNFSIPKVSVANSKRIPHNIKEIMPLLHSVIYELGVLRPKINDILNQLLNDIVVGLMEFYTHPFGSDDYVNEVDTCKMIVHLAKISQKEINLRYKNTIN